MQNTNCVLLPRFIAGYHKIVHAKLLDIMNGHLLQNQDTLQKYCFYLTRSTGVDNLDVMHVRTAKKKHPQRLYLHYLLEQVLSRRVMSQACSDICFRPSLFKNEIV